MTAKNNMQTGFSKDRSFWPAVNAFLHKLEVKVLTRDWVVSVGCSLLPPAILSEFLRGRHRDG